MDWPTEDTAVPRRISCYGYLIVVGLVILAAVTPFVHDPEVGKLFVHLLVTFFVVADFMYVRDCVKEGRFVRKRFDLGRHEWVRREDAPYGFWSDILGCCMIGVWATIAVARYYVPLLKVLLN